MDCEYCCTRTIQSRFEQVQLTRRQEFQRRTHFDLKRQQSAREFPRRRVMHAILTKSKKLFAILNAERERIAEGHVSFA
jgi:hypothetical protein